MKSKVLAESVARIVKAHDASWTVEVNQLPMSKTWYVWATNSQDKLYVLADMMDLELWFQVHEHWLEGVA